MRLNAVSVLFSSIVVAALPSNVKHEATAQTPTIVGPEKPAMMPAFVSLVSFPVFLLAAEDNATTSPGARLAAEVLSAKFAGGPAAANVQIVRPEPLGANAVVVPVDPKIPLRTADLSQSQPDDADKQHADADGADRRKATVKAHGDAKAPPATKRRRTARSRHRSTRAHRTAAATSGGFGASISQIVGFVGMTPDRMLTD